jgi:DNA-binding NarL/FixJ family response regulator
MEVIKVAIADGDTLLREGLKRILSAENHLLVVGEAEEDVEVVEMVRRRKPDVLLLDAKIPKREAVPVLVELGQKAEAVKTLILGSIADRDGILNTAKAGARGVILKRSPSSALLQAIRRVHRGEIYADPSLEFAEAFAEIARARVSEDRDAASERADRDLSKREMEIWALLAKGLTNREIGRALFVSERTIKAHLAHIFDKLKVNNRTKAALLYMQLFPNRAPSEDGSDGKKRASGDVP